MKFIIKKWTLLALSTSVPFAKGLWIFLNRQVHNRSINRLRNLWRRIFSQKIEIIKERADQMIGYDFGIIQISIFISFVTTTVFIEDSAWLRKTSNSLSNENHIMRFTLPQSLCFSLPLSHSNSESNSYELLLCLMQSACRVLRDTRMAAFAPGAAHLLALSNRS